MNVNLYIDRLVIDGLPVSSHDAPRIEAALSAELTRLIAEGGVAQLGQSRIDPLVRAELINQPAREAGDLGAQIGRAIHGAIGQ